LQSLLCFRAESKQAEPKKAFNITRSPYCDFFLLCLVCRVRVRPIAPQMRTLVDTLHVKDGILIFNAVGCCAKEDLILSVIAVFVLVAFHFKDAHSGLNGQP
jgi:hypothetical protein